jgi:autotransporter-associated beta strand protein
MMYARALMRRFLPVAFVAAAIPARADVFNMPAGLTSLKFSNVGNPGNVGDTVKMATASEDQLYINGSPDTSSGYGAVAYNYAIGTYDVTVAQYVQFLNAVATTGDPYGLYNPLMGGATSGPNSSDPNDPSGATTNWSVINSGGKSWPVVCGITRTGAPGNYSYALSTTAAANLGSPPIPTSNGNFPVNWDNWGDAARFCNWLENGQPSGPEGPGTTETGSYTLSGAMTVAQLWAVTRNPGATYWIPTENEWYKAAYYSPTLNGGAGGYWTYPTKSSTAPSPTLSTTATNNANFGYAGTNPPNSWVLTPVGYFAGSPGPYGTYDQGGDLYDFTETPVQQSSDDTGEGLYVRVMRGGSYSKSTAIELASDYRAGADPAKYGHGRTFRLATWYTTVWNGSGTGQSANNWSTPANWTGGVPTMAGSVGVAVQFGPLSGGHVPNNNDLAAGTQLNGISFASGAPVYDLEGNSILLGGPVTNQSSNTQTIGLAMQLVAGGGTFNTAAGDITVTGPLSGGSMGSLSLVKNGAGTLTLGTANTFGGTTLVAGGSLLLGDPAALAQSTLDISGGSMSFGALTAATLGGLTGTGTLALTNSASAPVAVSVGNNSLSTTFSGVLSGSGSLTTVGSGTLTLTASNSYTGGTTVASGTLAAQNAAAIPSGSLLEIDAGGSLVLGMTGSAYIEGFGQIAGSPLGSQATGASGGAMPPAAGGSGKINAVPEPGTLALLAAAAACGLAAAWQRRDRRIID